MPSNVYPPVPPHDFPPARTVIVPERGEFFLRDSGSPGPVVLMLHGWIASADLNFGALYDEVIAAGYRVIAPDHSGHGRGPRPLVRFRLADCADDAAALIRALAIEPAIVYGYSMGGAIAQLLARDHPELIAGLVLSGTAQHWQEEELRRSWKAMPFVGLGLSIAPGSGWRVALRRVGLRPGPRTAWIHAEMTRHSARAIAEAGRELGRFDSARGCARCRFRRRSCSPAPMTRFRRPSSLSWSRPRATVFDAPVRHLEVAAMANEESARRYNPVLLEALEFVRAADASGSLAANES